MNDKQRLPTTPTKNDTKKAESRKTCAKHTRDMKSSHISLKQEGKKETYTSQAGTTTSILILALLPKSKDRETKLNAVEVNEVYMLNL